MRHNFLDKTSINAINIELVHCLTKLLSLTISSECIGLAMMMMKIVMKGKKMNHRLMNMSE